MRKLLRSVLAYVVLLAVCMPAARADATAGIAREEATWGGIKAAYRGAVGGGSGTDGPAEVPEARSRDARYPLRDSPENALEKLRQAYELMDVEGYLDCLAEDMIFYANPEDVANDPWIPPEWYKINEHAIHENMFGEGGNVEHVTLSLAQVGDWVEVPNPGGATVWEYSGNYDLRMELFSGLTYMANEGMILLFREDLDQVGPGGEELWEVLNWWDVDRLEGSPVEASAWGAIKALFM